MPRRVLRSSPTRDATDLTDEQWDALAPLVTAPSHGGGLPTAIDRRAIVNALRSNHRTGCQWRMRPNDGPPMRSVRSSFAHGRDGTWITINDTLPSQRPKQAETDAAARQAIAAPPVLAFALLGGCDEDVEVSHGIMLRIDTQTAHVGA